MVVVPYVALAREKRDALQEVWCPCGLRVGGFMSGECPTGGFAGVDVAVCTLEAANGLINRLVEEDAVASLGIVVVDELHVVGDASRGYILELMLTKLLFLTHEKSLSIQLVAMSATLSAGSVLARWLGAAWFSGSYRPVPLREIVKAGSSLYGTDGVFLETYTPRLTLKGDPDHVVSLVHEVAHLGHSVLIFCPTRAWCERLALLIASAFRDLLNSPGPVPPVPVDEVSLSHLVRCLRRCPSGLDSTLSRTIPLGVAFHHAGLPSLHSARSRLHPFAVGRSQPPGEASDREGGGGPPPRDASQEQGSTAR
ncbi:DNA polymerase theta-like [Lampetra fluviatilis]